MVVPKAYGMRTSVPQKPSGRLQDKPLVKFIPYVITHLLFTTKSHAYHITLQNTPVQKDFPDLITVSVREAFLSVQHHLI